MTPNNLAWVDAVLDQRNVWTAQRDANREGLPRADFSRYSQAQSAIDAIDWLLRRRVAEGMS